MAEWIMLIVLAGFALYDMKTKTVSLSAIAVLAAGVFIYRLCTGTGMAELAAGLVPGALVVVLAFVTKESIGMGDGLMLCVLGMFCGWRRCLAAFGLALVLSAVLAIVLLVCRRAGRKTEIPFLPGLFGGFFLCCLW
ncbi:MAG: prepilin peptidase [Lachnospiraceae bacterium]|nr:prepilin peptidase [Lachnospiraceae bacterium]